MDKYQLMIEEKRKELDELEQDKMKIDNDYLSAEFERNKLQRNIYELKREISDLEYAKSEVQEAPKYFKKKKIENLLWALGATMIGTIFAIIMNGGAYSLINFIGNIIGSIIVWTPLYFFDTRKKRKVIKGLNLNNVEQQLDEKGKQKEQKEQEYELSKSKLESIGSKRNRKSKEIQTLQIELSKIEDIRSKAISQILDSLLEQPLSAEDSIIEEYKSFMITKSKENI